MITEEAAADTLRSGGANKANYLAARSRHDEALAAYRQALLIALREVEDALPAGVTLANATGSRAGAPYLTVNAAGLAAGASLTLTLNFTNPSKLAVNYSAQLFSGAF